MTRIGIAVLLAVAAIAGLSTVHYDGELHPVGASLALTIVDSGSWYTSPALASRPDDPYGVYVVVPALPQGARFAGVRVDTRSGEQRRTNVDLAPQSMFRSFVPVNAQALIRGLAFSRPALHLISFPDGRGAGVHRVESATGRLNVMAGGRVVLTRSVFNSSSTAAVLSLVSTDREGHWLAALTRAGDGWRLFLFERRAASPQQATSQEEL